MVGIVFHVKCVAIKERIYIVKSEGRIFEEDLVLVRNGDKQAIESFVAKYEPFIRRTIRFRLARSSLTAIADSVDVCQSVLGSFLLRLAAGEYELLNEQDLRRLLSSVANNKFLALQRRELAGKRDRRQTVSIHSMEQIVDAKEPPPDGSLYLQDLLHQFEQRLASSERELYLMRRRGDSWSEIAEELAGDAIVLRKRLSRAVKRVAVELKIDGEED